MKNPSNVNIAKGDFTKTVIGIVVSEYHPDITFALRDGCIDILKDAGLKPENIHVIYAPGAFEMPLAALYMNNSFYVEAIICLGCVIKGETDHDIYINHAVAESLMRLSKEYYKPYVFGLLTTNNLQQAKDRAGGKHGNKGTECAVAALKMLALKDSLKK
jgi:6,7-dimethyl-8-ribityllumazine synthase